MSDKAAEFVETWISNNVHTLFRDPAPAETDAQRLVSACLAEAEADGLSRTTIEATFGDLTTRMSGALELVRAC
ncbi:DUF768 domain-containing protein [Chelatococcus reniformis]|uniref:DUF768 domain-containing protein n=1 Tax=Chelatococcus reniformis TaxID=1494448 RepID=A0A916U5K5_9HYPH|nr:DUF768 domain-containing protein [Chelatococcus reniformis]GGC58449.1 hypothetical protein GCM10010994_16730 [Chelatococcus reniformis]